jgi:preprotein translocase subunit SecF
MFDFIERFKNWADGLDVDYCRWRYVAMSISGALMVLSWVLFFTVQPNWSTDFTGGTEIHLKFQQPTEVGELRAGLRSLGLSDDSVQQVNGSDSGEFLVRVSDPTFGMDGLEKEVRDALTKLYGPDWIQSMTGTAEVSARFVVAYKEPYKDYKIVGKELEELLPNARVLPTKDELTIAVEIPGLSKRIEDRIEGAMAGKPFEVLATDSIGPKVGAELRRQGFIALAATLLLILIYVGFRFDLEYAPGAIIALFHDVTLTMGVMVALQLDFSLQTVGALLTILGFSINDTIVIYDRIRENKDKFRRTDIVTLINKSVNETMTRTIATTFTVLLAIVAFLFWGGPVLRDFAIAMLCGLFFGSYSTIYIASPLIIIFQDLKPYFSKVLSVQDLGEEVPATIGGDGSPGDPAAPMGPGLTESEKRRRARADAEKRDQSG